ncbi:MAG: Gfo/Idh/MocA family oxidoreductase [Thermoguttaceae bacterium]|jgi:predicted dehydrogenase|nr:Gfo/Idh/MocA family oxidoreductase [Thermoguttaceae bacterium]
MSHSPVTPARRPVPRRSFVRRTLAAGAALALSPTLKVLGANDDLRVAVVGFRGHGQTHIRNYLNMPDVRVVALCDVDQAVLDREVNRFEQRGQKVDAYRDLRRLLERKDVDAVSVATPNHWHALATVWACQAGKDVCVEKPASHGIWEGRKMVQAARKYGRIVQADLDQRSRPANDEAFDYLHGGALGKIRVVRGFCYKHREGIGKTDGRGHIPETVDYDLWCGPAEKGPLDRNELHYDWHWVWNTGNGELGNNGAHQLDLIRWMLREPGIPRRAMSIGGRFGLDDAGQTANTQIVLCDFPTAPVIYEVRGLPSQPGGRQMDDYSAMAATGVSIRNRWSGRGPNDGVIIECEGGYLDLGAWTAFDNAGREIRTFRNEGPADPQASFVRAVRTRKHDDAKTDVEQGHLSACLSHLGNISHRLGKAVPPEALGEALRGDRDGLESLRRFADHLAVHNIDLAKAPATLGPWLTLDARTEQFTGPLAAQANALLKRQYREPFVIPDEV